MFIVSFLKIAKSIFLGGMGLAVVLVVALPRSVQAKAPQKSPKLVQIGAVQKQFPTDALCTLAYKHQIVLVDADNEVWMNLNGNDTLLLPLPGKDPAIGLFKAGEMLISVEFGSPVLVPPPNTLGMDGTIYRKAKIMIKQGAQSLTLPAKGGCDGGAGYGSRKNPQYK